MDGMIIETEEEALILQAITGVLVLPGGFTQVTRRCDNVVFKFSRPRTSHYVRTNCGSFQMNGYGGKSNDYMADAFIHCDRNSVVEIVCDRRTFASFIAARMEDKDSCNDNGAALTRYYGAMVSGDKRAAEGTMNFYGEGNVLLAETSGWTP